MVRPSVRLLHHPMRHTTFARGRYPSPSDPDSQMYASTLSLYLVVSAAFGEEGVQASKHRAAALMGHRMAHWQLGLGGARRHFHSWRTTLSSASELFTKQNGSRSRDKDGYVCS